MEKKFKFYKCTDDKLCFNVITNLKTNENVHVIGWPHMSYPLALNPTEKAYKSIYEHFDP